jgi:hypothetical protein
VLTLLVNPPQVVAEHVEQKALPVGEDLPQLALQSLAVKVFF